MDTKQLYLAVGIVLFVGGGCSFIIGTRLRRVAAEIVPPVGSPARRLLDTRARYELFGDFRDSHYDMFLKFNSEYEYEQANYWQIRRVYEKARWSTLFAGFLRRLR